jgi:hypothetical protein
MICIAIMGGYRQAELRSAEILYQSIRGVVINNIEKHPTYAGCSIAMEELIGKVQARRPSHVGIYIIYFRKTCMDCCGRHYCNYSTRPPISYRPSWRNGEILGGSAFSALSQDGSLSSGFAHNVLMR